MSPAPATTVTVGGRELRLSNLDKVLYPEAGFTKGQVIDYYSRIAEVLLPHLRQRPLTLKRYPNGVEEAFFYEKNCPSHRPDWLPTVTVPTSRGSRGSVDFCLVDELAAVVWVANLASLELHTSLSVAGDLSCPTVVAFDLDPGPPAGVVACARVALRLREVLSGLDLVGYPKTSGSKGLQVYVPLNTATTYDRTKSFALAVARLLEDRHPGEVLSSMSKAQRHGKVFIDWSQNDRAKTTVCAYSLRAMARPTVSAPLAWDEVEAMADTGEGLVLEAEGMLERVATHGDLFAEVATRRQEVPLLGEG